MTSPFSHNTNIGSLIYRGSFQPHLNGMYQFRNNKSWWLNETYIPVCNLFRLSIQHKIMSIGAASKYVPGN